MRRPLLTQTRAIPAVLSRRTTGREKMLDAYRLALQGILTSRHFIYLVEGETFRANGLQTLSWRLGSLIFLEFDAR